MKTFTLDIDPELENVTFEVKNGRKFIDHLISGSWGEFQIFPDAESLERIKRFAVMYANDKSSNRGNWYAHCNGYAMGLKVLNGGKNISINTWRPYGKSYEDYAR